MPSIVTVGGEEPDIAQTQEWDDVAVDRVFARACVVLQSQGVPVPKIAARLRVHRATVYRWIGQIPPDERHRLGVN
jgi:hypothetical protein